MSWKSVVLVGLLAIAAALMSPERAAAIIECSDCNCNVSCSALCTTDFGTSTCNSTGICQGKPGCGGGCLVVTPGGYRVELTPGEPAATPVEPAQGRALARLTWRLAQHVEESGLGEVFAGTTRFVLPAQPSRLLSADLSFVSTRRLAVQAAAGGPFLGAPDLVVMAADTPAAGETARAWLAAGARAVLVLDAGTGTVSDLRPAKAAAYGPGDLVDLGEVVPGLVLEVAALFGK